MTKFPLLVAAAVVALSSAQSPANAQGMSYSLRHYSWRADPAVNNYLSAVYDWKLEVNPWFRHYRMWRECHRINFSAQLHGECLASFDQYEPYRGYYPYYPYGYGYYWR